MNKILKTAALTTILCACQTVYVPQARDVKRKPQTGGIIAMPTNFKPEDRQKADLLMKQNCGDLSVKIADEGEVVTGQSTKSNSNSTNRDDSQHEAGNLFGIPVIAGTGSGVESSNTAITTQLKEWQVAYDCESVKPTTKIKK